MKIRREFMVIAAHKRSVDRKVNSYIKKPGIVLVFMLGLFIKANAQLSGTYTIDPSKSASSTNYKNILSAVTDLDSGKRYDGGTANGKGVSGPVVFNIANGTYQEKIHIGKITGTSAANTVLFQSASGDSTKVILQNYAEPDPDPWKTFNYTVWFDGVSYVTFSKMSITRLRRTGINYTSAAVVYISSVNTITIKNCRIYKLVQKPGPISYSQDTMIYIGPYGASNISILNNYIKTGVVGVGVGRYDNVDPATTAMQNLTVYGNILDSLDDASLAINYCKNAVINNNTITGSAAAGIFLMRYTTITSVSNNRINVAGNPLKWKYGNELNTNATTIVANNILNIKNNAIDTKIDEEFGSGTYYFINNTIYAPKDGVMFYKDSIQPAKSYFYNNLIYNTSGTNDLIVAYSDNVNFNYNNYYLPKNGGFMNLKYGIGAGSLNLSQVQSILKQDLHSINVDPDFVDLVDFVPQNNALNAGVPSSYVTKDINGKPRDPYHPTIGAIEIPHTSLNPRKDTSLTLCKGSCIYLKTPVAGNAYAWSTSATADSAKYCASGNDSVLLKIWTGSSMADTLQVVFHISTSDCVWPGDANSDKIADIYDILNIGVAFGDTGSARPSASTSWTGQPCLNWASSFSGGVNHKHADCDGNGQIDSNDIPVISLNYGKTHAKATMAASGNPNAPTLVIKFTKDSAAAGDTVNAVINLGTSTRQVTNIYGVVAQIQIKAASPAKLLSSDFSTSWLGTLHKDMAALVVYDTVNNIINAGLTRTDHKNVNGYGQLGALSIVMPADIAGKREVKEFISTEIIGYKAISASEATIELNPVADSVLGYQVKDGINPLPQGNELVHLYPNPANDVLYIDIARGSLQKMTISNITGNVIYDQKKCSSKILPVDISQFPKGIYIIDAVINNMHTRQKFIKE